MHLHHLFGSVDGPHGALGLTRHLAVFLPLETSALAQDVRQVRSGDFQDFENSFVFAVFHVDGNDVVGGSDGGTDAEVCHQVFLSDLQRRH